MAAAALVLLGGCSGDPSPAPSASAATATTSACPSPGLPDAEPSPRPAQPVDDGTPPPAPTRVDLRTGSSAGSATVVVDAPAGVEYESSELRVLVNGCRVPWTDEGDQLPHQTIEGLRRGDRVLVLARLNGLGGNSAETASAVLVVP